MLPKGWVGLYATLLKDIDRIAPQVRIKYAAVNFGQLAVYFKTESLNGLSREILDALNARVETAERISTETCMECGNLGELHHKEMKVRPLCEEHNDGWKRI